MQQWTFAAVLIFVLIWMYPCKVKQILKSGQRSSSNVKCSLAGHSRCKVRSVLKYAASSHNRHEDHHSVSHRKSTIIDSPLQKLLSSSGCVVDRVVGGSLLPFLKRSSTPLYGEGTLVNRPHSRGTKEPLHWFVLEAVLLICLPMNEWMHWPSFLAHVDKGTWGLY